VDQKEQIFNGRSNFFLENKNAISKFINTERQYIDQELEKINCNLNGSQDERINKKMERRKKIEELFTRKTPAYENCSILAPDGMLLW
jgi:hypothetical protein